MSIHPQEFFNAVGCGYIFVEISALLSTNTLPSSTARVTQMVAVRFLIGMDLERFECVGRDEWGLEIS